MVPMVSVFMNVSDKYGRVLTASLGSQSTVLWLISPHQARCTGVTWFPSGALVLIHQTQTSGQHTLLCLPGPFSNWLICEGRFPILDKWFHKYVLTSGFRPGHSERF